MPPLSRRDFLAQATLTGTVAARLAAEIITLPRPLRVAVIGLEGHVGEITSPLPNLPQVKLAACATPNKAGLDKFLQNPSHADVQGYADYRDMLSKERFDVVAVTNSNGSRAQAIVDALASGAHVIAEKPVGVSLAELRSVQKAVEQSRRPFGLLLPMRYESPYLALHQIVKAGHIGEPVQIDAQKSYIAGQRPAWMRNRKEYGGTLAWIGIHMIDLMRWASGCEYKDVVAQERNTRADQLGEMENVSAALYTLTNGGLATLRMDYQRPASAPTHGDDRLRIAGTKGVVEYMAATGVTLLEQGKAPRQITSLPERGWVFTDYLRHAFAGAPATLTEADIWRVNEVTLQTSQAAAKGQRISL